MSTKASIDEWVNRERILGRASSSEYISNEDVEAFNRLCQDVPTVIMLLTTAPYELLATMFFAGMDWQRFKDSASSPMNDLLDSVKGL